MGKIDTSGWKEYRMSDLGFTVCHGSRITKAERVEGNTVFLTAGFENCGVVGTIGNENIDVWEKPITVDMFGNVFYHDETCAGDDNIYAFLNSKLSRTAKLFVASSIASVTQSKYSYQQQFRQGDANKLSVSLPTTPNGAPDWAYMESYMANLETRVAESLSLLQAAKDAEKKKVDTREWGSFALGTLFNIVKGKRLTKAEMKSGKIPFIGSSALNNGCTAMIGNDKNQHPENTITVCYNGSVGETFYQDQPYIASDDVNVLYPKFTMNRQIALFIVPLIKGVSSRYDYIDKWKKEAMEADKIYLPIDKNGDPDWDYMEEYMKMVQGKTENVLNQFVSM